MTAPHHLPHAADDCTGEWEREREGEPWTCPRCGARHPATPENDAAELREYLAGVQLRNQTRRGRFDDLPPPRPPLTMDVPDPEEEEGEDWR